MGSELGVPQEIIDAPPTDGLWDDGRTDQDQLGGISYSDLEKAMQYDELGVKPTTSKDKETLKKYRAIRAKTVHKMMPIPVCKLK
jgi:NAD+ synthase